ncbi:hypothetical protein QBC47DRAFT_432407 [Echria macrotheca]|uniref:Protein kinase domain-containing protein n=1 Tax=Echria macrotheca TaxID=438768 RepID=A0AAJ0BB68_9PEZI|nr:hypothetical protein QBC47DRAFT_432407 [Echria macrotheca]
MDFPLIPTEEAWEKLDAKDFIDKPEIQRAFIKFRSAMRGRFAAYHRGAPNFMAAPPLNEEPKEGPAKYDAPSDKVPPWLSAFRYKHNWIRERRGSWHHFDSFAAFRGVDELGKERARRLSRALYPWDIRLVKVLGAGGFGIACLFETTEPGSAKPFRFVFKYGLKRDPMTLAGAENEKRIMRRLRGALHIVRPLQANSKQRKQGTTKPSSPPGGAGPATGARPATAPQDRAGPTAGAGKMVQALDSEDEEEQEDELQQRVVIEDSEEEEDPAPSSPEDDGFIFSYDAGGSFSGGLPAPTRGVGGFGTAADPDVLKYIPGAAWTGPAAQPAPAPAPAPAPVLVPVPIPIPAPISPISLSSGRRRARSGPGPIRTPPRQRPAPYHIGPRGRGQRRVQSWDNSQDQSQGATTATHSPGIPQPSLAPQPEAVPDFGFTAKCQIRSNLRSNLKPALQFRLQTPSHSFNHSLNHRFNHNSNHSRKYSYKYSHNHNPSFNHNYHNQRFNHSHKYNRSHGRKSSRNHNHSFNRNCSHSRNYNRSRSRSHSFNHNHHSQSFNHSRNYNRREDQTVLKGVLGMQWPPYTVPELEAGRGANEPCMSESVPQGQLKYWPLVHFDLDPQNVLIGDFGEPHYRRQDRPADGHKVVPVFKLNDFGLARYYSPARYRRVFEMWSARIRGKPEYFVPEQFTAEWDWVHWSPALQPEIKTAGKYGYRSNIFGVGLCVWSAMTLHKPSHQPHRFPTVQTIQRFHDGKLVQIRTYGGDLLVPDNEWHMKTYSAKLRCFVAQCLAENPGHRPGRLEITRLIDELARFNFNTDGNWANTDIGCRAWCEKSFAQPPEPASQNSERLKQWLRGNGEIPLV